MCNFQTEMADKVLKQSTWNQLQEQLQELSFQERYHTFLFDLPLDRLLLSENFNLLEIIYFSSRICPYNLYIHFLSENFEIQGNLYLLTLG